jgi:integration host factor subunit alpha
MGDKTVTRAELTNAVYQEMGVSLNEAGDMVDAFFEEITETLGEHEPVKLSCFGSFKLRHKKARVGRNPKTGVEVIITPRTVLSFNPSNLLKQQVNDNLNNK